MATTKKRTMVNLPDNVYQTLDFISRRDEKSLSRTVLDLIESALEIEEDYAFNRFAAERLAETQGEEKLTHEEFLAALNGAEDV